jgi:hypothetical protein
MKFGLVLFLIAFQPQSFGPDGKFHLEHSNGDFGMRSHGVMERLASNRTKFYPLPQSTVAEFLRLRSSDPFVKQSTPVTPSNYRREEVMGAYQLEGDKIWFGKSFYDGEGCRGVGAFGYFDTSTRSYTLFSPPEVVSYEVSAILVQPDTVWLGLDEFIEDISTFPGGLVRWDRATQKAQRYPLEFVIQNIQIEGDSLRLKARDGYALFHDGEVHRFLANGRPTSKFAPPLSNHTNQ